MAIGRTEKIYVYCHNCKKLIFKGPLDEAVKIRCEKTHTITSGKIEYINTVYPDIDTSTWESLQPKKGHLLHVRGNVCEPQKLYGDDELSVIPHCCNNKGVMGAGVAKSLREKWISIAFHYMSTASKMTPSGLKNWLGEIFWEPVENNIAVVNMIAQDGTCTDLNNPKPVKYWALLRCMQEALAMAGVHAGEENMTPVFHCPKFGSDLAGGDWNVIEALIVETWIDRGFDVVIYDFEADREKWGVIE